ncbi:MAG: 5-oxoprolinase subunit PxpB [Propionibacteriaceae bacterium]|nr:MAG: 5-oxoprolinase subunit PxpB [Propionibacteriaceae bacterium]
MLVEAYGDRAVLVRCTPDEVTGWAVTLRDLFPQATDVVPAARTVLVDGVPPADAIVAIRGSRPAPVPAAERRLVEIPVEYAGPDLAEVAARWRCSERDVAERHRSIEFTVAFCGFAPGFAYLTGLPDELAVPRLATPRTRVPAGSVGLAGRFSAIYPTASPGGWQLIGRTEMNLWDVDRTPPALLTPGTRVRFVDG